MVEVGQGIDAEFAAPKLIHEIGELVGLREDEKHPFGIRLLHGFDRDA